MGGQLLGLSLFVMLLAFFIILNAISTYEQAKVKAVMESVEFVFATKSLESVTTAPSMTESDEHNISEGDVLDRMKALFTSQIPGIDAKVNKSKGTMHITVSYKDFEDAVLTLGQGGNSPEQAGFKGYFLKTLVALMMDNETRVPYHMEAMLNVGDNPARMQNQAPEKAGQAMRRMSMMAEKIEAAGLPQKLVSIGLKHGSADMVDLLFQPHRPFNPLEKNND